MKKTKVLASLGTFSGVVLAISPLAVCSCSNNVQHIIKADKYEGEMTNYALIHLSTDKHYKTSDIKIEVISDDRDVLYPYHESNGNVLSVEVYSTGHVDKSYDFDLKVTSVSEGWTETVRHFKFGYTASDLEIVVDGANHNLNIDTTSYDVSAIDNTQAETKIIPASIVSKDESIVKVLNDKILVPVKVGTTTLEATYPGYHKAYYNIVVSSFEKIDIIVDETRPGEVIVEAKPGATGEVEFPGRIYNPNTSEWISVTTIGDTSAGNSDITSVVVPSPIENIDEGAFEGCENLTNVDLSGSDVQEIEADTFKDCDNLEEVKLPETVTSIGEGAFEAGSEEGGSLKEINLPSKLETIGDRAFENQKDLTNIEIPSTVTSIGEDAFTGCDNLTTLVIDSAAAANLQEGGLSGSSTNTSLFGDNGGASDPSDPESGPRATTVFVREDVVPGDNSFITMNYEEVVPSSKEGYKEYRVAYNKPMQIYASKRNIDNNDTIGAVIEKVTYKDVEISVPFDAEHVKVTKGDDIATIDIEHHSIKPKSNTCHGTIQITISYPEYRYADTVFDFEIASFDKLNYADKKVWAKDTSTTSGNVYIPTQWFENNTWNTVEQLYAQTSSDATVGAFEGCANLNYVSIPSCVQELNENTFKDCKTLSKVEFLDADNSQVTKIGKSGFENCTALSSINLPKNITEIGEDAFKLAAAKTGSLTKLNLPDELQTIKESAFENQQFGEIIIPSKVTSIEKHAFTNCRKLYTVIVYSETIAKLSATVEEEETTATDLYDYATIVNVPLAWDVLDKTTFIGKHYPNPTSKEQANWRQYSVRTDMVLTNFKQNIDIDNTDGYEIKATYREREVPVTIDLSQAKGLLTVVESGNTKKIKSNGKAGFGKLVIKFDNSQKEFSQSIQAITYDFEIASYESFTFGTAENATSIAINAKGKTRTSLYVPSNYYDDSDYTKAASSVSAISGTFEGCNKLKSITLNTNITSLPDNCFSGLPLLETCKDSSSDHLSAIKTIGASAFEGCDKITSFKIGNNLSAINQKAFKDSGLTSVSFSEIAKATLKSIYAEAFANTAITSFTVPSSCGNIIASAFNGCEQLKKVYINNSTIANTTTSGFSLFTACSTKTYIYISNSITLGDTSWLGLNCIKNTTKEQEENYNLYCQITKVSLKTSCRTVYRVLGTPDQEEKREDAKASIDGITVQGEDWTGNKVDIDNDRLEIHLQIKLGSTWVNYDTKIGQYFNIFEQDTSRSWQVTVKVKDLDVSEFVIPLTLATITGITIEGATTSYERDEIFDTTNLKVKATLSNGSSEYLTDSAISELYPLEFKLKYDDESSTSTIIPGTYKVVNETKINQDRTAKITVSTKEYQTQFTATYDIKVHWTCYAFSSCEWSYIDKWATKYENEEISEAELCCHFWKRDSTTEFKTELNDFAYEKRTEKINGLDHTIEVIGTSHDKLTSDNSKKATFTLQCMTLLSYKDSDGNILPYMCNYDKTDDWQEHFNYTKSTTLRNNLTATSGDRNWIQAPDKKSVWQTLQGLDSGLTKYIKKVQKVVGVATQQEETNDWEFVMTNYDDYLFPLTAKEINREDTTAWITPTNEGELYYGWHSFLTKYRTIRLVTAKDSTDYYRYWLVTKNGKNGKATDNVLRVSGLDDVLVSSNPEPNDGDGCAITFAFCI